MLRNSRIDVCDRDLFYLRSLKNMDMIAGWGGFLRVRCLRVKDDRTFTTCGGDNVHRAGVITDGALCTPCQTGNLIKARFSAQIEDSPIGCRNALQNIRFGICAK
jgi:hypothetical protein